jgi:hypothetical protein
MGNKQLTAIEWLDNELCSLLLFEDMEAVRNLEKLITQAKEMEKKQMIEAWNDGAYGGGQFTTTNDSAEEYYKENYGE